MTSAVAEFIASYKSGQEVPSFFELAALELGTEELAKLPESLQEAAVECV